MVLPLLWQHSANRIRCNTPNQKRLPDLQPHRHQRQPALAAIPCQERAGSRDQQQISKSWTMSHLQSWLEYERRRFGALGITSLAPKPKHRPDKRTMAAQECQYDKPEPQDVGNLTLWPSPSGGWEIRVAATNRTLHALGLPTRGHAKSRNTMPLRVSGAIEDALKQAAAVGLMPGRGYLYEPKKG